MATKYLQKFSRSSKRSADQRKEVELKNRALNWSTKLLSLGLEQSFADMTLSQNHEGSSSLRNHWIQQNRCWSTNDCRCNNGNYSFTKLSRSLHLLHGVTLIAVYNLFHTCRISIVLSQPRLWDWSHVRRTTQPTRASSTRQSQITPAINITGTCNTIHHINDESMWFWNHQGENISATPQNHEKGNCFNDWLCSTHRSLLNAFPCRSTFPQDCKFT